MPEPDFEDELYGQLRFVETVWKSGAEMLRRGRQMQFDLPSRDEILAAMDPALDDVVDHLETYRINMRSFDCNKLVNYVAWHIRQQHGQKYDTFPLFFGHLSFIDDSVPGASLFNIPHLPLIAENMRIFHNNGHKMAPYTFLKGVDLTFNYCCQPPG